jgi:hypothetical protein
MPRSRKVFSGSMTGSTADSASRSTVISVISAASGLAGEVPSRDVASGS